MPPNLWFRKRPWGTLTLFSLSCLTASAAFVAVEFSGRITGSELGHRASARLTGYFTYESGDASGPQTASRPNFVFEIPADGFRFERSSYQFYVYNNWPPPGEFVLRDGLSLQFPYPQGYGAITLLSSNTTLFANNQLPPTIPALEQFDANQTMYLTVDGVQPSRSTQICRGEQRESEGHQSLEVWLTIR